LVSGSAHQRKKGCDGEDPHTADRLPPLHLHTTLSRRQSRRQCPDRIRARFEFSRLSPLAASITPQTTARAPPILKAATENICYSRTQPAPDPPSVARFVAAHLQAKKHPGHPVISGKAEIRSYSHAPPPTHACSSLRLYSAPERKSCLSPPKRQLPAFPNINAAA
jgi:hypothetical protein